MVLNYEYKEVIMDKELQLKSIVNLLLKKIRWIIFSVFVAILLAVFYTNFIATPLYSSTTNLLVSPKSQDNLQLSLNQLQTNSRLIETYKSIIFSDEILDVVSTDLGGDYTNEQLKSNITVLSEEDAQTFSIRVIDESPEKAAKIANTVASVFQSKLDAYYTSGFEIKVISEAKPSEQPISPILSKNILFATILAIVSSNLIIILMELLKKTVSGRSVMEQYGWLELGDIGGYGSKERTQGEPDGIDSDPNTNFLDNIEAIKARLQVQISKKSIKTFMITGIDDSKEKTVLSLYLAQSFAQGGKKVLLVDANLRNPRLHHLLRLPNEQGLGTYLNQQGSLGIHTFQDATLSVILAGPKISNYAMVFTSDRLGRLVEELETRYDVIIFNAPPLDANPDGEILSTRLKNIVTLIKRDVTKYEDLNAIEHFIDSYDVTVLGYVMDIREARIFPKRLRK